MDLPIRPNRAFGTIAVTAAAWSMAAASPGGAGAGTCVATGQAVILKGVVTDRQFFGPPNFGETPELDERRIIPILLLNEPIDLCEGTADEIDTAPIAGISEVQLVNYSTRARGVEVVLTGELERAQNAFHHSQVFLVVR